jgi:hypothetical protein
VPDRRQCAIEGCQGWLDWAAPGLDDDHIRFCNVRDPKPTHAYLWEARKHEWLLTNAGYHAAAEEWGVGDSRSRPFLT